MGLFGTGVAIAVVILGIWGSLIAARRPTGFIDVPVSPLQFLVIPLSLLLLFSIFVILAILRRRDAQMHKRCMVLASLSLVEAAVGRWPLAFLRSATLLPVFVATVTFVTSEWQATKTYRTLTPSLKERNAVSI